MSFHLDPYGEFGPRTGDAGDRPDPEKLRLLADWFDAKDAAAGVTDTDVQDDLRRIAGDIEQYGSWLRWFTETLDELCRYDHDGRCQAHFLDERPCPMEAIREALA